MNSDRREFLKSIGILTGGLLLLTKSGNAIEQKIISTEEKKDTEKKCASLFCKYNANGICSNYKNTNEIYQ